LALAIDMAKKHRAGRPQRASQRKKASTPTARALPKVRKKAKAIGKNAKPKAKRRAALAAKGGGNATAAGVTFQASVGAIVAVQMLTESFGDSRLGLPPFKVKILRFESDAPLDDIAIETDQNGWLLLQAKTALGLSTSLTSEFGKTVLQIVRQWHAGLQGSGRRGWDRPLSQDKDRLVIAVGPGASQTLTNDLAKALDSIRASASAPPPLKQRTALKQLTTLLKQAWKLVAGQSASAADIAGILPFISVLRFDPTGADRVAAVAQLRLLTSTAPAASGSFVAAERESQALMERRHGGDVCGLSSSALASRDHA
jgi:hypothetical protein